MRSISTLPVRARGMALVAALIFLLVLTILGVASMSGAHLQEKMAANLQEQTIAFQAAETGLRAGEDWIFNLISKPDFPNNKIGLYLPSTNGTPQWDIVDWNGGGVVTYPNVPGKTVAGTTLAVAKQPRYIVEDLGEVPDQNGSLSVATNYKGKGTTVLRITAHGAGRTPVSVSEVQSTYWKKF